MSRGSEARVSAQIEKAVALYQSGQFDQAIQVCEQLINKFPKHADPYFLLGDIYLQRDALKAAANVYIKLVKLRPRMGLAWARLAQIFRIAAKPEQFKKALVHAIENYDKGDAEAAFALGNAYALGGQQADAANWFKRAVDSDPQQIVARNALLEALIYLNDEGAAKEQIENIVQQDPGNAYAHWQKSLLHPANDTAHIDQMKRWLAQCSAGDNEARAYLAYALGKEYEDLGQWEDAYSAFESGAANRRKLQPYDHNKSLETFSTLKTVFSNNWLNSKSGTSSDRPIFVCGLPRMGTTLLERIISSHTSVGFGGELDHLNTALHYLSDNKDSGSMSPYFLKAVSELDMQRVGESYLNYCSAFSTDAARFVDKLPLNSLLLPVILAALPDAKVVLMTRDARDACFAMFKQMFAPGAYPFSYDQREVAEYYLLYDDLLSYWQQEFSDRFYLVQYERLVKDTQATVEALFDYLELPWEEQVLEFYKRTDTVSTASTVQVRENTHTRSIDRWKCYQTQLAPMLQLLENK